MLRFDIALQPEAKTRQKMERHGRGMAPGVRPGVWPVGPRLDVERWTLIWDGGTECIHTCLSTTINLVILEVEGGTMHIHAVRAVCYGQSRRTSFSPFLNGGQKAADIQPLTHVTFAWRHETCGPRFPASNIGECITHAAARGISERSIHRTSRRPRGRGGAGLTGHGPGSVERDRLGLQ